MALRSGRVIFRSSVILFIFIYMAAVLVNSFVITALLSPAATILAFISLKKYVNMSEEFEKSYKTVCNAFMIWIIIDVIIMTVELFCYYRNIQLNVFNNVKAVMYMLVKIIMLVSAFQLYLGLTEKYSRFQRIADMFATMCCVISTMWIIFFAYNTAKSVELIMKLDFSRIFAEAIKLDSMLMLGVLMISWFQFQYRKMTIGQRLIVSGLALMAAMDMALSFNYQLLSMKLTDIVFKTSILLIAIGGELYDVNPGKTIFIPELDESERMKNSWKNTAYLISYPIMAYWFVGLRPELVMYVFIFSFYITACLYVKQLNLTDQLLSSEKSKNDRLKLYLNVLEQLPLSIVITDCDGNIEYVNNYFTEVSGYAQNEVIGKSPNALKADTSAHLTYEKIWESISSGNKWIGEFTNVNKSGAEYDERAIVSPILDDNGKVMHYASIKENITESLKMKLLIDNQYQFIAQLSDNIPSAIFHVSSEDIFLGANAEFKAIYDIDTELYRGTRMDEVPWMNEYKFQIYKEMKEASIKAHAPVTRQITRIANGKETPVLYSLNAYYSVDGTIGGFIGMMTDISELKEKERELNEALDRANAATEAKSLFLANMSHEIRTPMNAVIGMSYLALKTELTEKQRDYLTKINTAASSLLGIINDILDFSKIESGKVKMEYVDFILGQVVTNSMELLMQKAYEKNLRFIYHLADEIPAKLIGDPLRLGQIITNLVSNAVKFTHRGEIRVEVTEEKRKEDQICLKFSVIDTGIGISTENKKYLFEAFTQSDSSTTREYGGTGLGLAICKRLVEMMKGEIWVVSEPGNGSEFNFTAWFGLSSDIKAEDVKQVIETGNDIAGARILLAEDNIINQQIVCELLEGQGAEVEVVDNGIKAVKTYIKNTGNYDLIFMDLQMPLMDGIEAALRIREISKDIPIIAMTARTIHEEREKCYKAGMNDYILKPIEPNVLLIAAAKWRMNKPDFVTSNERLEERYDVIKNDEIPEINGIDVKIGLMRSGGNVSLYKKLLKMFMTDQENNIEEIDMYYNQHDIEKVKRCAHLLVGVSGNLGAEKIYELSKSIENIDVERVDEDELDRLITELKENLKKLADSIEKQIVEDKLQPGDDAALDVKGNELVEKMIKLLNDGDFEAIEYLEKNNTALMEVFGIDKFNQVKSKVHTYKFDDAALVLQSLERR